MERPRPPRKTSSAPLALALILGVLGLVALLYLATGGKKASRAAPQDEEQVEDPDPFADLPPEPPRQK
jgi:hypothetical protein